MDNVVQGIRHISCDANHQLHNEPNRAIRHSTVSTQDNSTADNFQGISIRNRDVFLDPSLDVTPGQTRDQSNNTIVNPYWPSQHRQHMTKIGLDHQMPILPSTPVPAEPTRVVPSTPKPLNQNQVHAQTHPWRIKVYNACLACRKKKIKCDGQPTCGRCARLGFECSYIEVPQAPQSKNAKQKARSHLGVATTTPVSGSGKSIAKEHLQSGAVDTAKEICWERRPSIKDAASRSVPHSTSQRFEEPHHHRNDIVSEQPITNIVSVAQAPTKDQQASSSASEQLDFRPVAALAMDRDAAMPDLYRILVSSVAIPNVSIIPHSSAPQTSSPTTAPVGSSFSIGMVHLNLTLAQQAISNIAALDVGSTNTDQHRLSFQKDPLANSFLDQTTPLGFVITNKSVIQYLVHVYFECFHVHWMIVDKEKFLTQLNNPATPPDPLLLVVMCAAGAKCSDHEGLCTEPGNLPTIGEQFLTHARILLQDRFDMASMSTLQALLILYWCQVQTGRASLRFMYAGMAIRMAQEMGLNRHIDPKRLKDMDEREVQIRKTIWWSCYQADRWTSAALGKPMVISDVDCLVDYPSSITESERYHIQSFCHMTDLAKILGKVLLNLYTSTSASTCSSAVFSHLDESLSAWIDSVPSTSSDPERVSHTPPSLDGSEKIPSRKISNLQHGKSAPLVSNHQEANEDTRPLSTSKLGPGSVEYHALLYHTVRIMLYRIFLHNSTLIPALPLTLQSPQSRCRESAVAISEIAENMVVEQRSCRQFLNSVHFSLCAAATVHRFVITSPMIVDQQDRKHETMDVCSESLAAFGTPSATTSSSTPPTPSKTPSRSKTDLHYLTLILRILQNCCRFSIEKNLLRSIIDAYLPIRHLNSRDLVWARYEINKPFTIIPVDLSLSSSVASVQSQMQQQEQQQEQQQKHKRQHGKEEDNDEGSSRQFQARRQQYQMLMRQTHQQARTRQLDDTTVNTTAPCASQNLSLEVYIPISSDDMTHQQGRHSSGVSPVSSSTGHVATVATVAPGAYDGSTAENQQLQQHQRELNLLQQHHHIQQSELHKHHQQQTLQLEQAQLYQRQQQNQDHIRQNQRYSFTYIQQQHQQQQVPLNAKEQHSGGGVLDPKTQYSDLPDHVVVRNKRQSEASFKKKQAKQKQINVSQELGRDQELDPLQRQQQQQCHGSGRGNEQNQIHERQYHQRQETQTYSNSDSYLTDATPQDVGPGTALDSLSGLAGNDEMTKNNPVPSAIYHLTGAANLPGASGITSLDEFLSIESIGYYSDMPVTMYFSDVPVTNTGDNSRVMNPTTLPLAGPASTEGQDQTQLTRPSNNPNIWHTDQQQPSNMGSNDSSNADNNNGGNSDGNNKNSNNNHSSSDSNSQVRGDRHSQRDSVNESVISGSLQFILANNDSDSNQARFSGGSIMTTSGPANSPPTWLGFSNISAGNPDQLPPLNLPRHDDSSDGYRYPYTLHAPQKPTSHPQSIPCVSYQAMERPIGYTPSHPYVYIPENGEMDICDPTLVSQGWQPQPQLETSRQLMLPQLAHQQQQQQQMYSPRVSSQPHLVQQLQDPNRPPHCIGAQIHQSTNQPTPHQAHGKEEREKQEQYIRPLRQHNHHLQQRQQLEQQQHQQRFPKLRPQGSPQSQQQQQQQVRHPVATILPLLPPFPQSIYTEDSSVPRLFSLPPSNSTLASSTSASNSGSSQMESSLEDNSRREPNVGGKSTSRNITVQFESGRQSPSDLARMSRSMESFTNESSSPILPEDASSSNESGSSLDNNKGPRSLSADPIVATADAVAEVGSPGNNGNNGGSNNEGSSEGGYRHGGKKSA